MKYFLIVFTVLFFWSAPLIAQTEQDPGVEDAYIEAADLPLVGVGHPFRLIYTMGNNANDEISGIAPDNIVFTIQLQKCAPAIGGVITTNGLGALSGTLLDYFDFTYNDALKRYTATQKTTVVFPGIASIALPAALQIGAVVTNLSTSGSDFSIGAVLTLTPPAGSTQNNPANDVAEIYARTLSILPVTLADFTGVVNNCNVLLNWTTSLETNFSHFEVAYSENGVDYSTIKSIPSKQSATGSQYQFTNFQQAATGYYRLKMVDIDGTYSYSNKVLQFKTTCSNNKLTLFPNPVINDKVTINGLPAGSIIQIHHIDGKLVRTLKAAQSIQLINMANEARGTYIITVVSENKTYGSFKIIKQ
jgi:hypothetical protein